ncbi:MULTISPECIES: alpha-amylase family glycosyl hydrolase [unclassified Mycoplasma]|uniref:alpha-amylase family glycosyl hydrolase n=1 Tax=unclassified Mycoplasma TaxID=2683645 RepID=UPI00197B95AF|nr:MULTISPECIES: alpha-amylase family glycosyl hydrolase [unclassified Mycoplasma]MBN4084123.1 alpha-amylase [Mycoplasma sp. CSL10166]MCU4706565.1 alpha-amylase family glycosyl hydrolase [Mycoplasma sp. CSL7503-lung]
MNLKNKALKKYYNLIYKKYLKNQLRKEYAKWDDPKYNDNINQTYKDLWKNAPKAEPLQNYKNTNIMYQVLVYSFADGNNDGIGDFIGLKNKLDYLSNLGVDQIWLSPLHPSSSYHGYNVKDYCNVADQLGGMDAFIDFLSAAHKKGIKVYLDLIFNHTSFEHPWFQKAIEGDELYKKYYRIEPDLDINDPDVKLDKEFYRKSFPKINQKPTNKHYLARFSYSMPDLNLDNKVVIDELVEIQKFWTAVGVDGFRYDAIAEYFSSEIETKNNFNEAKIFSILRKASDEITKPAGRDDVFMVGEWVFTDTFKGLQYLKDGNELGLNTVYDGFKYFRQNTDVRIPYKDLKDLVKKYEEASPISRWMPFIDNHDTKRWLDVFREEVSKNKPHQLTKKLTELEKDNLKIALFQLMALPGNPIIYQGDELYYFGTRYYGDPSLREPMKWSNPQENCFIYDGIVIENLEEYILLTSATQLPVIEEAIKVENSPYSLIQYMSKLREEYPFLKETNSDTIVDPYTFIDTDDYSSVTVRKAPEQDKEFLLFAFCNYKNEKLNFIKISRDYHFKPVLLKKTKNYGWNFEMEQGGYAIFKLIKK